MILSQDQIQLVRLERHHLELVRGWRISSRVSKNMEYQEYISPADQEQWFEKINQRGDFYFVFRHSSRDIGLIHLADVDFDRGSAESGIFVGEESALGTPIPIRASICILDFAFLALELETVKAKVSANNANAIAYNEWLGFELYQRKTEGFDVYMNSKQDYFAHRAARKNSIKISDDLIDIRLSTTSSADQQVAKLLTTIDSGLNYRLVTVQ